MGKSRKQKKAEEREARQAKQKSKKKKETAMSEAMAKAIDPIDPATDKPTKSTSNGSVSFGLKGKGSTMHVFFHDPEEKDFNLACDKNYNGEILISPEAIVQNVTCKKCLRLRTVKDLLTSPATKKDEKKKPKPKEELPKPEEKAEDIQTTPDEESYITSEEFTNILTARLKTWRTSLLNRIEVLIDERVKTILSQRPDFMIISKSNGKFAIIHEPSRYVITDNIQMQGAEEILQRLLLIPEKWDGQSRPSKDWLSSVAKIFEEYKESNGKEKNESTLKVRRKKKTESKEPKLSIRRKKKTVTLKVRRRGRK